MINFDEMDFSECCSENLKGPLSYKYIMTSVDVYESIHHIIITC